MSLRTFIHGLVGGTKSDKPKTSTSTGFESSSNGSGNLSKGHSSESNEGPYRAARDLVYDFLPMFRKLNEQGTDYCVVGGMAVLLQSMDKARDSNRFRATHDADIMFGSFVRGEQKESSDVDLLIETGGKDASEVMDIGFDLAEGLGRDVDMLTTLRGAQSSFVENLKREGRLIYRRD